MKQLSSVHDLTTQEWSVHLDEAAEWQGDNLSDLQALPERCPTGGWQALDHGRSIVIPASTYDVAPDYHGVSWWSTEIEVSAATAFLHFQGARLLAEVYIDGRRVHVDLEGMTPFEVQLPYGISAGKHRLDLRVTDPGGGDSWMDWEPIAWGGQRLPASHGFGGPWLPVHLEQPGPVRISGFWVRSDREMRRALVDFRLAAATSRPLRIELIGPSGGVGELEVECAPGHNSLALPLTAVAPYGPGHPNLHTARIFDGENLVAETQFGLRVLDFDGTFLRLNGEPFRLATSISWGWYRRGPVPSAGDCEREAAAVEAFGMNALSAHRHLSTPALQDALEERGLLLYQEAGGIATTIVHTLEDRQREEVERLSLLRLRRLAQRDRGRACLAWWNLANEVQAPQLKQHDAFFVACAGALHEEDGSRLVTGTSGWGETPLWHPFETDRRSGWDWHRVYVWPSAWHEAVAEEIERYQPAAGGLAIDGESATFTSLGRIREIRDSFAGAPPDGAAAAWVDQVSRLEAGLQRADPDGCLGGVDGLARGTAAVQAHAFARLIEAHRRLPGMHGLAINGWHQHHRIGTSGIVAPDRSPIIDPLPLQRANGERALAVCLLARALRTGSRLQLEVELLGPPGSLPEPVGAEVELTLGGKHVWAGRAPASPTLDEAGLYELRARLDSLVVEDAVLVVDPGPAPSHEIAILEDEPVLQEWFAARGVRARSWRIRDGLPLLTSGWDLGGVTGEDDLPPRVASLHRAFGEGSRPFYWVFGGVSAAEARPDNADEGWMDVQACWIGGWAFSVSGRLPSLGPAGVWGAERAALHPRLAQRQAPGRWLTSAVSFPQATTFDIGQPAVGATTWQHERAGREFLVSVLPLVERRDHPLGEAALMDLARWLAEAAT